MLTSDDLAQMRADLQVVRDDRSESIAFRRGAATLPAQTVRIARSGSRGSLLKTPEGQETRGQVIVIGDPDLDIQIDDRFNDAGGQLYRITFVRPNRTANTVAEADLIQ